VFVPRRNSIRGVQILGRRFDPTQLPIRARAHEPCNHIPARSCAELIRGAQSVISSPRGKQSLYFRNRDGVIDGHDTMVRDRLSV
jgi:hypothetical protein